MSRVCVVHEGPQVGRAENQIARSGTPWYRERAGGLHTLPYQPLHICHHQQVTRLCPKTCSFALQWRPQDTELQATEVGTCHLAFCWALVKLCDIRDSFSRVAVTKYSKLGMTLATVESSQP